MADGIIAAGTPMKRLRRECRVPPLGPQVLPGCTCQKATINSDQRQWCIATIPSCGRLVDQNEERPLNSRAAVMMSGSRLSSKRRCQR